MNLFHPIVLRLPRIQSPKHLSLTISHNLNHHDANVQCPIPTHLEPNNPPWNPAEIAVTLVSNNCASLSRLNQALARVIRTHMLESPPASSFHWNVIIKAYTRLFAPRCALRVYAAMSRAGVSPDTYTLPFVVKAACQLFLVRLGRQLHSVAVRHGLARNEYCESGLITLYSKAGEFENARKVFDENPERKLGSWNALIAGSSQGGHAAEAIALFLELRKGGVLPDDVTMVSVTSACGSLGDLNLAAQLHTCVFQAKAFAKSEMLMLNSLIDMYGKCGRTDLAYGVFSRMEVRNVSSWTSIIVGYAMQGHAYEALECFRGMRLAGVTPNWVTFVGVLSACVHGGMVREGMNYFAMMKNVYGILPELQHYGCMVDLLGRAGLLEEARNMVETMPMEANAVIWGCFLGACEKHENVKMGEWVAKHLLELEPWSDGVYVVLSNIYASNGMWKEVERMRKVMREGKLAKAPGYSMTTKSD